MAKKPIKKESEQPVDDGPAAWGVEVCFYDETRQSEMYSARKVITDRNFVTIMTETDESVSISFKDVSRVLLMHSSKLAVIEAAEEEKTEESESE